MVVTMPTSFDGSVTVGGSAVSTRPQPSVDTSAENFAQTTWLKTTDAPTDVLFEKTVTLAAERIVIVTYQWGWQSTCDHPGGWCFVGTTLRKVKDSVEETLKESSAVTGVQQFGGSPSLVYGTN